ncbi:MAG: LysM peptidoglycan-binding domain-containing protein [Candidatus Omnitrophica bacterium]|nr:LysM peptidoglycan-binding domain-containing protein [Candidatus Omnitrophota bacterium]
MKKIRLSLRFLLPLLAMLSLSACSSREIKELQLSVSNLENRLTDYRLQTSQESEKTVSHVSEVNQSINNAFRDIRYAQSNLETLVDQLSNRLSKVERDVASLQQNAGHLSALSDETFSALSDKQLNLEEMVKIQRQQDLNALQQELDRISSALTDLQSARQNSDRSIRNLERQFSSMNDENRKIYRQILTELGANIPTEIKPTAGAAEDSGQVHMIQSGETLSGIADKYNVSVSAIQQLNQIENPSRIRVGQQIKIPK